MKTLGIYVHIPYCISKCRYCDFVSRPVASCVGTIGPYFEKLKQEIEIAGGKYKDRYVADTVFFGGGTPTAIDPEYISKTLKVIRENFFVQDNAEISLEANPGTLSREKLLVYKNAGFNRISLGIQSLNDNVLKTMGRIHNRKEAEEGIVLIKEYFSNFNLDLMLGVPNQNLEIFRETLNRVLEYKPPHLSFYSLQMEEGTPFYKDYKDGRIELPSWEENRAMYHLCVDTLKEYGYHHYEVSNAALPSFECRHNLKYWTMGEYLGFGEAAHSFIEGKRFAGEDAESEDMQDLKGDFIFTGLRLIDGLDLDAYQRYFKSSLLSDHKKSIEGLIGGGLLVLKENKLAFTTKGLDSTNLVLGRILNE